MISKGETRAIRPMTALPPHSPAAGQPYRGPAEARGSGSGNLLELLERTAHAHGWLDRTAYLAEGVAYRFAEVYAGARRTAAAYAASGLGRGSRILLALPDGIEFVWAFLGALHIGAVAVPVNSDLHPDELRHAGAIAEAHAVVALPGLTEHFMPSQWPVLTPEELDAAEAGAPPYADCDAGTPAFAAFTSGTTGDPRLCFHTHGDPVVFNQAIGAAVGTSPGDIIYSVSRMYFMYGLGNSLFFPLLRGATAVLTAKRASQDDALAVIARHGVTVFYGQPSFYARMLGHPDHHRVLGVLRLAVVAGEVLPQAVETRLRGVLGERLLNIFGTTETGHAVLANGPVEVREFTLGRVLEPYRLRIVDDDGREVAPGDEGRLQVAGPTIGLGVSGGGDTPRRLAAHEWYTTGDAATVDSEGFVRVLGRLDDIEIVGGANVHPTEVECLLMKHPAVREAAVCSVWRGQGVSGLRAFVVLADDTVDEAARDMVRRELLDTAEAALTWYKVPEDIAFTTELPRTDFGKLLRRRLRAMAHDPRLQP